MHACAYVCPYSWDSWLREDDQHLFWKMALRIILRVHVRAYYMYGTTTKFKSANIFISAAWDQTAKFKNRQYFRLYTVFIWSFLALFSDSLHVL